MPLTTAIRQQRMAVQGDFRVIERVLDNVVVGYEIALQVGSDDPEDDSSGQRIRKVTISQMADLRACMQWFIQNPA